jgi:hypothetical protein
MKLKAGRKSNYDKNCGQSYRLWNTIWHRFDVPWWWVQLKTQKGAINPNYHG